jgi:hypothetical protein
VHFENNKPVIAEKLLALPLSEIVKISDGHGYRIVKWIVVSADDEKQAIEEAGNMYTLYILPWQS